MGHNGFLNNVSVTPIDKTGGKNPKIREDYLRRTLKTYLPFGLHFEDSVWPTHIVKNVAYELSFYGIVWILVRQGLFMDYEFGHDY